MWVHEIDQDTNTWNIHRESENTRNTWRLSFGSGTKLFITFLSLRFLGMGRERHNFFLCWLFHLDPHHVRHPRRKLLVWPRRAPENQLSRSEFKSQLSDSTKARASRRSKLVSPRRAPKIVFLVRSLNLNKLLFSNPPNPQLFRAWRYSRPRSYFPSGFLLWHL